MRVKEKKKKQWRMIRRMSEIQIALARLFLRSYGCFLTMTAGGSFGKLFSWDDASSAFSAVFGASQRAAVWSSNAFNFVKSYQEC